MERVSDINDCNQVEETIKKNKELYRNLFNHSPLGIFHFDMNGILTDCNDKFTKIIGARRDQLINLNLLELLQDQKLKKEIKKTLKSGSGFYEDYYTTITTQKTIPIIVQINAIYNTKKNIIGAVGLVEDITERKKIEDDLIASKEMLHSFIENATEGFALFDENFNLLIVNKKVLQIFPTEQKKNIIGKHILELAPEFEKRKEYKLLLSVIKTRKPLHFDNFLPPRFGQKHLSLSAFRVSGGLGIVFSDVTERIKRASEIKKYQNHLEKLVLERTRELQLHKEKLEDLVEEKTIQFQHSEERYRILIENSDDAIMRFDREHRYLYINPITEEMMGISIKEFIGKKHEELGLSQDLCLLLDKALQKVFKTKKKNRIEFKLPNNTWLDWKFVPEFGLNGEVDTVLAYARDITERKKAEEHIENLLRDSQELVEMKSNFISTVSHEFRTPLSTILMSSELLELCDSKWTMEKKIVYFNRIRNNINSLVEMLNDISILEKGENGNSKATNDVLDIIKFGKNLIEEAKNSVKRSTKINFITKEKSYKILTNKKLLKRILLNLLTNAFKYTQDNQQIEFQIDIMTDFILFTISDEGIGIPEKDRFNIFDPFFRASNVGTIRGTGMGLAITQQAVKSLNGKISFESKIGEGSKFTVLFPLNSRKKNKNI